MAHGGDTVIGTDHGNGFFRTLDDPASSAGEVVRFFLRILGGPPSETGGFHRECGRTRKWSQFRSTGRQRGRWFSGWDMLGTYAGVAGHVTKSAASNRTRHVPWQSLQRAGRLGVRAS
jgi:hypothetical protein